MNNEPVAWTDGRGNYFDKNSFFPVDDLIPLYTHPANPYQSITDTKIEPTVVSYTHPVKELNDGGEPVKNATYWKRQHDNLLMKLNTCAVKLSELEKKLDTRTRELISASFYEHDYKTLMAKPQLTDGEIVKIFQTENFWYYSDSIHENDAIQFARAILRKAQEK